METKVCSECGETKPVSEYHESAYGYPLKRCKPCHNKFVNKYRKKDATPPQHEIDLINYLQDSGIFALHGREIKQYKHVDVVAWGMIRIEAKLMKLDDTQNVPYFYAGNSPSQVRKGWKADVVCLIHDNNFHFFDVKHPAFYINNKLKTKILYTPGERGQAKSGSVQFTDMDFAIAKDAVHKIEAMRRGWVKANAKPRTKQLELLPKAS